MSCHFWIKQEPEEENEIKCNPGFNHKASQDFDQIQVKEESERATSVKQELGISDNNSMSNEVCLMLVMI